MKGMNIGFALCGSFCTFSKVLPVMEDLGRREANVIPIMSETAFCTDTRFGTAQSFIERIEGICGKTIIHTIKDAEPIGPKKMFDVMLIAPCTGNTLAKIAHGIVDTTVTMAAKAHIRNERPLVLALATNDALSAAASNIGTLLNRKNVFFVPFAQDDPEKKPRSAVADMERIPEAIKAALEGKQIQPIYGAVRT
ncbi:MAG: dipicolinate synthase subunit B [Bacillota bacterium]|nr:dipicolinate synthase subunit B [Bacillota bacterium]